MFIQCIVNINIVFVICMRKSNEKKYRMVNCDGMCIDYFVSFMLFRIWNKI